MFLTKPCKMSQQEKLNSLQKLLKMKKSKAFYASKLGVGELELDQLIQELKQGKQGEITKEVNNEKGTLISVVESSFDPKSDTELAELHKVDLTKYKISSYWSKLKSNGKFTSSVFATLKKPTDYNLEDFAKFLENYKSKLDHTGYTLGNDIGKEEAFVELNISDFHLAKKTIQGDTLNTKEFDYLDVVVSLTEKIRNNYKVKKLVFPISNDFFHSDNSQNTTTNGTPQDVTVWYDEEYEKGFDILATTIHYLLLLLSPPVFFSFY